MAGTLGGRFTLMLRMDLDMSFHNQRVWEHLYILGLYLHNTNYILLYIIFKIISCGYTLYCFMGYEYSTPIDLETA